MADLQSRAERIGAHQRRAPRYLGVGTACILLNNALLILLDAAGIHYAISVMISVAVMIPLGFVLQSRITFAAAGGWAHFARYAAVMLFNVPLAWLVLWAIHSRAGVPMVYASPLMTGTLFFWNYLASGWAITARSARSL